MEGDEALVMDAWIHLAFTLMLLALIVGTCVVVVVVSWRHGSTPSRAETIPYLPLRPEIDRGRLSRVAGADPSADFW